MSVALMTAKGQQWLSRPHLANALAGRYSLSKTKVVQLHAFLAQPPPVLQPRLI